MTNEKKTHKTVKLSMDLLDEVEAVIPHVSERVGFQVTGAQALAWCARQTITALVEPKRPSGTVAIDPPNNVCEGH